MEKVRQAGLIGGMVLVFIFTLPIQIALLVFTIQVGNIALGIVGWGVVLLLVIGIPVTLVASVVDEVQVRRRPKTRYEDMSDDEILEYWPKSLRATEVRRARRWARDHAKMVASTNEQADGWDAVFGGKD